MMRHAPDGSYWHPHPSQKIRAYMDANFERVPNESRWLPRVGNRTIKDLKMSATVYIVTPQASVSALSFEPGSTVLCCDNILADIEARVSDASIRTYGIQLGTAYYLGTSERIVALGARYIYGGGCYVFDKSLMNPRPYGIADCAATIARMCGAKRLICYGASAHVISEKGLVMNKSPSNEQALINKAANGLEVTFPEVPTTGSKKRAHIRSLGGLAVVGACLQAIASGLEQLGYACIKSKGLSESGTDVCVVWNGYKSVSQTWATHARRRGASLLYCEHGFIKRADYAQIDTEGFLHMAAWARRRDALPAWAEARLLSLCTPQPVRARTEGDILILGQVDNDSQLQQSDPNTVGGLLAKVSKALPTGVKAVFRPHPSASYRTFQVPRGIEVRSLPITERDSYRSAKQSTGSLHQALEAARFVVAINSNSLVDATIAGVPCLAFGPAIGLNYGAYASWSEVGLQGMLDGWAPNADDVDYFLKSLVCHQWSNAELRDPRVLSALIAGQLPEEL